MSDFPYQTALIVGAGAGISASLARKFAALGVKVGLAARNADKLGDLCKQTGAMAFAADASNAKSVAELFAQADTRLGVPDVVVYNAGARLRGLIADLDPAAVEKVLGAGALGGFTSRSRRRGVWSRAVAARCCSRAPPPASRAIPSRRPSP